MLTFLKLFGIFFVLAAVATCGWEVFKFLRKKKLESSETQEGLSALTWEEMRRNRGAEATGFHGVIVRRPRWRVLLGRFLWSFVIWFCVVFCMTFWADSLERLAHLEELCLPGVSAEVSGIRQGKVSSSLEGLKVSDPFETRIKTCKDWGFNP